MEEQPTQPVVDDSQDQSVQTQLMPEQPTEIAPVPPQAAANSPEMLEWQASEYIEHEKSRNWFLGLAAITVVLVVVAIFILQEYTFALLVVVMAAAVVVWARRPATEMHYRLDPSGIWVNEKFFPFHDFRAFGVVNEGAMYAVSLLPIKRFSPAVSIYFPEEYGQQIVEVLGGVLPMQEIKPDIIDRITNKLNF